MAWIDAPPDVLECRLRHASPQIPQKPYHWYQWKQAGMVNPPGLETQTSRLNSEAG